MRILIIFCLFISLYATQKISILLDWKYQFEFAGYIAAKEKGFYKDAGVDVQLVEYNNQNIVKDVLDGKYNFGIYDNHLVDEKIEGKPVKLVASIFKRSALVLVTNPNIKRLKDLEHKKIMIAIDSDVSTLDFLKDNGVDISTITFVKPTFNIKDFVAGKVSAMSAFLPNEVYQLKKEGVKFKVINPSDYNFLMYQGEFFTSDKFAKNNPVLVSKIKKATIKGWKYALKHKEEIINLILKKYNTQHKSKEQLEYESNEIKKIIEPYIYPIGYINRPLLEAQFQYKSKKMDKKIDIKSMLDDYIFEFKNPLNLSQKYVFFIKLYNIYLQHKITFIFLLIFFLIFLIILYFYLKLKKHKDEIETLFNKAPVSYILMNYNDRIIVNANEYAYKMFNTTKEYMLNRKTKDFYINEEDYDNFRQQTELYVKKHNTIEGFNVNWRYKKVTGEPLWVNISATTYNKDYILWILSDITDLIDSQNNLKKAMKVKEEFLANMSHEIRTPLNAILGFVNIIYNKEQDKENKKYLKIIQKSGKQLLTVINDILDFSKIGAGKLKIEKIEFNPKEEFETLIALFDSQVKEKNINLKICFDGLDYNIVTDPIRIKQVISNLISNAIKFTPSGKNIFCNIKYNAKIEKLYVEVIDEGIGIEKNRLNNIFEAFSQADTSITRKYGGTGLGLTISKNLVNLLGGDLNVKSGSGKGSKFYFSIPAKKRERIENNSKIEIVKKNNINFLGKVLIVEDNKANQLFFKVILNSLGIKNISIANDGLEALDMVSNEFDIIFMDENMPNMNGIESSKKIKSKGINIPIIAVTANALSGDKERFLEVMDDYLAKPVEKEKLIEILNKYLKGKND